jgi:hypothetical protein
LPHVSIPQQGSIVTSRQGRGKQRQCQEAGRYSMGCQSHACHDYLERPM